MPLIELDVLRPDHPDTARLLVALRDRLQWGSPIEIGRSGRVEIVILGEDAVDRIGTGLRDAARALGVEASDYLQFRPR